MATKTKVTKKAYEKHLNGLDVPAGEMLIGGKFRKMSYGTALRKHDPIAFEIGFDKFCKK